MNVAITRARRHVAIIGDSTTIGAHAFLCRMLDYFSEHGDVRSAAQYGAEPAVYIPPQPSSRGEDRKALRGRGGSVRREAHEEAKPKLTDDEKVLRARALMMRGGGWERRVVILASAVPVPLRALPPSLHELGAISSLLGRSLLPTQIERV